MYSSFQLAKKYIRYYFTAANSKGHGMHSPFVFDFILRVLNNRNHYLPPTAIEKLRRQLLHNPSVIEVEDLGAGSRRNKSQQRVLKHIAKTAVKPKKYSQFFFRLVRHYKPQTIVELGTSLGITTAYMAMAEPAAKVYTIEGSGAIQQLAVQHFKALGINNIESFHGAFDDVLPQLLASLSKVDLAYVDGNHRLQPTLHYFQLLLQKKTNNSIFIFDDIHWSSEMEAAWEAIRQHPEVTTSIDLFFIGIVFFRQEHKIKQHFSIRF